MIRFQQVSIDRGGKTILKNVSFSVERGQKIVLTGPSGSGKSSLLMALMGFFPIVSGKILFEGYGLTPKTIAQVRRSVAFIGQEPVLGAETIREAIMLPFQFRANRNEEPGELEIRNVLERLKLDQEILEKRCSVVSGGEKQRVAIARALLMKKKVFLADEITSALDAESRRAVFDIFSFPSCTALLVSHDPEWIKCFDGVLEIRDGTVRRTSFRGEG